AGAPAAAAAYAPAAVVAPVAAAAPRPAAVAPPPDQGNLGLGGTMMMDQPSPMSAPVPGVAAARRAGARPAVDLFAQNERPSVPGGPSGPGFSGSSATTSADRLVGERNENSVLFSLSAL